MEILFVSDPLESFKIYKDTTFAMMREAQRRGHAIVACEPQQLAWQRGGVVQAQVRAISLTGDPKSWFTETASSVRAIKDFGAVVMRKDPPFDSEFFYATHLLEQGGRAEPRGHHRSAEQGRGRDRDGAEVSARH